MKKVKFSLLVVVVIILLLLSSFSDVVISKPTAKICDTFYPDNPCCPCSGEPTNCFCPIIVTPDSGSQ